MAKDRGTKLISKIDFCPEYREDGEKTAPVEIGRFKYFGQIARKRNASLLTANLMFLLFLIPVLAIFVLLEVFGGVENIAYKLSGTSNAPYLLSGIGFGMSNAEISTLDIRLQMLNVYYIIFAAIGLAAFVMCMGYGGMTHLSAKFIMNDVFIAKKDNYGNLVPRAIKEYFKGVKRTAGPMAIVGGIMLVLFAGIGNIFVWFVGEFWKNNAGAGHWILVIFAGIIALFTLMFLVHFIPAIVVFDAPLKSKAKNSIILAIRYFLPTLAVVIVFAVPFVLSSTINLYISVIILAVLLVYGSKWTSLILCNYEQYIAEKLITPVYNGMSGKGKKQKNKNNKK